MQKIAKCTWECGDPGMQFDDVINKWHTSKNSARINASNPCSEYMFLDNSACNLASLNLMRFVTPAGAFDIAVLPARHLGADYGHGILVDNSGYPTEAIARNSHDYRPLAWATPTWRAADVVWPGLRLRGRPRPGRRHDGHHVRQAYLESAVIAAQCAPVASATPLTASVEHQAEPAPATTSTASRSWT